eukprot:scaffold53597_cov63-Phaeocystis_antarctica.AAC.5
MRAVRLLRSTEGVGAESQVRGVAGSRSRGAGKQAGRWRRGSIAQAGVWRAGRRGAGRCGAGSGAVGPEAQWRTWVGVVSLMRVPDEGGDWRVPDTSAKPENQFIFSAGGKVRGSLKWSPEGADARCWNHFDPQWAGHAGWLVQSWTPDGAAKITERGDTPGCGRGNVVCWEEPLDVGQVWCKPQPGGAVAVWVLNNSPQKLSYAWWWCPPSSPTQG